MPEFQLPLFLLGCLGGILPDALRFARNRYDSSVRAYAKTWNFWGGVVILVLIGGVLAWVLNASTAKDALIIGYTAPQIISELVGVASASKERTPMGTTVGASKMTNWWSR